MSITKEQVLLLIVVLLALWIGSGYLDVRTPTSRYSPAKEEYVEHPVVPVGLVGDFEGAIVRRDFFTEPSETRPLPPRQLAFPPLPPLSVCGLPLDPGPDYRHSWQLRLDGAQVEAAVDVAGAGLDDDESTAESASEDGQDPALVGPMSVEQASKQYDRLWIVGQSRPMFVSIEPEPGVDLFALEEKSNLAGTVLKIRVFSRTKRELGSLREFGRSQPIQRIRLADNIRNEVRRRVRRVPADGGHQAERLELIEWLLDQARSEAWIQQVAFEQAEVYLQMSGKSLEGRRVMQRVLRALGDLEGERKLLAETGGDDAADAFRLRGLGRIKARLGLWIEAEADLREAARLQPTDAENHGELAEFLRRRGRTREALQAAERAAQTLGSVQDKATRQRIVRTILACRMAVGADGDDGLLPDSNYLRGCLAYAHGDIATAKAEFQRVSGGDDDSAAQLGLAACHIAAGEWQQAYDLLQRVADQDPLLRDRAACALALMFSRLSQFDTALSQVDRALEMAPDDPYALYLRGRTLRLMGQYAAAKDALAACLRQRDDFVHAIVEMAAVYAGLAANASGEDQANALLAARRYQDRAVALSPEPVLDLLQRQGVRCFAVADRQAAVAAFTAARDLAAARHDAVAEAWAKGALAVVTYSRGRVEDAATALMRIERDLGRDSELGKWADRTVVAIEDHARKEALGDSFEREKVGDIWEDHNDGPLRATIRAGRLVYDGTFSSGGSGEVFCDRVNAVKRGKDFLACAVTVELLPGHEVRESFVGLGIEMRRNRGEPDLSVRVGLRDGKPHLSIQDGANRAGSDENFFQKTLPEALLVAGKPQKLELRVVPLGGDNSRKLQLQVWFNGAPVHVHELRQLTGSTSSELKTMLFATGDKRARVAVAFDDYRLERRKNEQ